VYLDLRQPRGRAHPVQRLVGAAVGVDKHRAVGLDHDEALGSGKVGVQATGVVHGAGGNDNQPVDLLFALLVPADQTKTHLHTLSLVAKRLADKTICRRLRAAQS
ncbi:Nitrogen regulatory protein, partial [human gut metagenome]